MENLKSLFSLRKVLLFGWILLVACCFTPKSGYSWGFEPHKRINRTACLLLPKPLFGFYKKHIEYITEHAVDPDKRRYTDTNEAVRHYIDLEDYHEFALPIDTIPWTYDSAVLKYGKTHLTTYGNLPWNIFFNIHALKNAFIKGDVNAILKISADLGHYVADAHVPLHTTSNYDGQLTNQKGIHSLWETLTPTLFMDTLLVLNYVPEFMNPLMPSIWNMIHDSHELLPLVLSGEKEAKQRIPESQILELKQDKNQMKQQYSSMFISTYHTTQQGAVEARYMQASKSVANCIYTAWILAGEPKLPE
jgi:hypothetical protein